MAQLGLQEIVPDQVLKATKKQGLEKQQQKTPKPKTKSIKAVSIKKAFNSGSRGPETLQTSQAYPPNIAFSHKRVMAPKRKILEIFTSFEIQAP